MNYDKNKFADLTKIQRVLVEKLTIGELEDLYGQDCYSAYWSVKGALEFVMDDHGKK